MRSRCSFCLQFGAVAICLIGIGGAGHRAQRMALGNQNAAGLHQLVQGEREYPRTSGAQTAGEERTVGADPDPNPTETPTGSPTDTPTPPECSNEPGAENPCDDSPYQKVESPLHCSFKLRINRTYKTVTSQMDSFPLRFTWCLCTGRYAGCLHEAVEPKPFCPGPELEGEPGKLIDGALSTECQSLLMNPAPGEPTPNFYANMTGWVEGIDTAIPRDLSQWYCDIWCADATEAAAQESATVLQYCGIESYPSERTGEFYCKKAT